jgi:hypothetical protein
MSKNKFDNFAYLQSALKTSSVKVPFHTYIRDSNGSYSFDVGSDVLMQIFWRCYIEPYGKEFIVSQLGKVNNKNTKQLVECCLENLQGFIDSEIEDFYRFIDNVACVDFNFPEFLNEIPVLHIHNIHHFIKKYNSTPHINKWSILLAYWVYRMNYYDEGADNDNEYILTMQNALRNLNNRICKDNLVPNPNEFIKAGLVTANKILKSEGLMTFDLKVKPDINPPLSGIFFLSPKFIRFMDGFVWLYHPKFPGGGEGHLPMKYDLKESRKVYSNISDYLLRKLPPIQVESKNGRIKKVISPVQLNECIELIEHKSAKPSLTKDKAKPTVHRRDVGKSEAEKIIRDFKSRYLDYLCASQLEDYKVVCCIEQRTTESGAAETEYSFIFTIQKNKRKTLLVFENVNPSRSTYVIEVNTSQYEDCIDNVFAYFASDILNKRQKMANGELRINHPGIRNMNRMFHKNYLNWCASLRNLKYSYL